MALKSSEIIELSGRSREGGEQARDPGDRVPVARFSINDQLFLIFCEDIFNALCVNLYFQKEDIVGELLRDGKRYIITAQKEAFNTTQKSLVDILTKREIQIMMLVAQGKVNKEIADQLNISEWTVSSHLRRMFAKLGVDSRAAMIFRCSQYLYAQ
jgi:DNA-binding CsgD family transcriptional regulator